MGLRSYNQLFLASAGLATIGQTASASIDFARDIQPILNANCIECHGGVKAAGDVSFVYEERVINFEGKSGGIVVKPGDAEGSELIYRVTTDDEDDRMPPPDEHPSLTRQQIELLSEWIESGAKWSGHWAFQPPSKPPVPKTAFEERARGDIDRFLFARIEEEGLELSPAEEPGRLLRRLSLALTGLPPSLAEFEAFEDEYAANSERAVESVVDDLMSRPAFGERWAAMWLDLVRYADSGGLGQDQRRTIWAYRDWVVRAFNSDMPFDQFTIKQLAGDLLPEPTLDDLVATACQRNTQTNVEGGTDDEQFRVEAVIDRVNTTWQTWGSVTFGCVQCHDHPYDPLRHEDYYRFMAFYNNSADSDLNNDAPLLTVPDERERYEETTQLRDRILELKEATWKSGVELRDSTKWNRVNQLEVKANNGTKYVVVDNATQAEFHTVGTVQTQTHTIIEAPAESFAGKPITALQLTALPLNPKKAVSDPEWGFLVDDLEAWVETEDGRKAPVCFKLSLPDVPWMPTNPMVKISPNGKNWGADTRIHYARKLILVPEQPILLGEAESLTLHIHCNKTSNGSDPMAIKRGYLESSSDSKWTQFGERGTTEHRQYEELARAEKKYADIPGTTVPIMLNRPEFLARQTHVFQRGNAMDKGDRVVPGLPASLLKVAAVSESPGRLEMARWWVSEDNPLTARVFVNRLWEQLFGIGIVPTLEDFGSSGAKPTHPELLDYLAIRFQQDYGWSLKKTLREIVLSYTYLQGSRVTPELLDRDPDNRLLARGPRLRLTAEMVRDQALTAGGLLSAKIGGPPVHPPLPEGVWLPFTKSDKWKTPEPGDEDRYRRSIYTYIKRSIPYPAMATFDAPSREFCSPRRLTSNTPLQALMTLNDAAFVECAEALGERLQGEFSSNPEESLSHAYRLVTGRWVSDEALDDLVELYRTSKQQSSGNAWTLVAQVLLNLDETLTF